MKQYILVFLLLSMPLAGFSQISGSRNFYILDIKTSARVAALGGDFLPVKDADISVAVNNPSLINSTIHNSIALDFVNQFSGINYGMLSYSRTFEKIGSFTGSLQYANYGSFPGYDEYETELGSFHAADYLFIVGWGRDLDSNFSIGANLKPILSQYETSTSFALGVDVAANYHNQKRQLDLTLLAKNIGAQLVSFDGTYENLPFQLELGVSKKLKNAPFRLFAFATNLQKWDLRYEDPLNPSEEIDPITQKVVKSQSDFGAFMDNLFRHTAFGVEFAPSKSFFVRLGYNYKVFKEMKVGDAFSLTGFTYGFGFRVKQFNFSYARGNYHSAGSPNYFTIATNFDSFFKGKAKQ